MVIVIDWWKFNDLHSRAYSTPNHEYAEHCAAHISMLIESFAYALLLSARPVVASV